VAITEDFSDISYAKCGLDVYPNPFSDKLNIKCIMNPGAKESWLKIYDVTGRVVKNFGDLSIYRSPFNQLSWNGMDDSGFRLPAGVYFVRLKSDNFKAVEKIILLK
jgi:hypothetical protein